RDSSDLRGGLNTPVMCPHSCLCCTSLAQLFCVTSPHCFIPITSLSPSLPASPFESTYLSPLSSSEERGHREIAALLTLSPAPRPSPPPPPPLPLKALIFLPSPHLRSGDTGRWPPSSLSLSPSLLDVTTSLEALLPIETTRPV